MQKRHNITGLPRQEVTPMPVSSIVYKNNMINTDVQQFHYHPCIEIGLCMAGSGVFFISDEIFPFRQGDISVVYPGEAHDAYRSPDVYTKWHFLFVNLPELTANRPDADMITAAASGMTHRGRVWRQEEQTWILPYLERLISLHTYRYSNDLAWIPEGHDDLILHLTACLLLEMQEYTKLPPEEKKDTGYNHWQGIQPAVQYMFHHYMEDITTEELCALCFISHTYLRRLFVDAFREPPISFLHRIRIRHACAALEGSDQSILSISERCGYTSLSSFNRQFQKIMHLTPSQYRKKKRKPEG